MKTRTLAVLLLLAGAALAGGPAAAQAPAESPALQAELQDVQNMFVAAQAEFDGTQQSRSIVGFDRVIERLESLRRQGQLPQRGRDLLAQAFELRGRAYYGIGLSEKATEDFGSLVRLVPQYQLSREKVSPKVVDFFDSVKKSLVGFIAVESTPAGARVSLNGEFLSLTNFFPMEVLAGDYTVEIAREGYAPETRQVTVAPRATQTLQVPLTRTAASTFFITEPAGVEIWVDGRMAAVTGGALPVDQHEVARARGLDPLRSSARTEVANLSIGAHRVEFRRRCYEPVAATLEIPEAADFDYEPVKLEDSLGTLVLRSDPAGARIIIDGESMGLTPRELTGVCSGKHRLEVKHQAGKFVQEITLARGETLSLDCPIRPSLAFLGVVAASAAGERLVGEVEEKLVQNLARIQSLNVLTAPRELVDNLLSAEQLTRASLVTAGGATPDQIRRVTEALAARLEVQGFLIAQLPDERLLRTATLHLLAAGNATADQWDVVFSESASYLRFIGAIDQKVTLYRPWTGLITVDTLLHEGVPVLRLVPDSPAARAGLKEGDIVYAVDGQAVRRTADLQAAAQRKQAGQRISLHVRGADGATRAVDLTLESTPQEIPLYDPGLLYNKLMMDLRQQVQGYPGTEAAAFARLNLALCAWHFEDFAAAHEHVTRAAAELPKRPGLSRGTALYYVGVALERLGYKQEAIAAYREAAAVTDATLFDNDGPPVAPLAARRASGGTEKP
ncbi:MAG: PEGA domain-containing protein [Vicinamibacteria bacterium]|nr:PEGA domain-containing protein [Vicinamibacteria bacterium]